MNLASVLFVLCIVVGIFYWISYFMQRYFMNAVAKHLYQEANPEAAAQVLESTFAKLFIAKAPRLVMLADVYIVAKEDEKLEAIFKTIEGLRSMGNIDKVWYYQKKLSYFATNNNGEESEKAYARISELFSNDKISGNPRLKGLKEESDYLIEIYIRHNTDYLDKMLELAESIESPVHKGIYYYRAAKLYYYKNEEDACREYLQKSAENLKGSQLEQSINDMLQNDLASIAVR